jgi:hypothetical protein
MAYALAKITDHIDQGVALLLEQFQGKPRIAALLTSLLRQVQDVEDAAWDVLTSRLISVAADAQLDALGKLVGEPRDGRDDGGYRVAITARIAVNRSSGTGPEIVAILKLVDVDSFRLRDVGPAAFRVDYGEPPSTASVGRELPRLIGEARPAGVAAMYYAPVSRSTGRSALFGSAYDPALNQHLGFSSSYDALTGGLFGHAVRA